MEELRTKEQRYTEVMSQLQKEAEEKPKKEQNPHDMPWKQLDSMSHQEVRACVDAFYEHVESREAERTTTFRSGSDIANAINESKSVTLPPSIIATLDSAISSGKLEPAATHDLISITIAGF